MLSSMNSSILRLLTRRYAIANSALATLSRHFVHCSQCLSHFFSPSRRTRCARKIDDARRQQSHDSVDIISREACSELCIISLTSIHPYRGSFLVDRSPFPSPFLYERHSEYAPGRVLSLRYTCTDRTRNNAHVENPYPQGVRKLDRESQVFRRDDSGRRSSASRC